jgi:MSHA pilin protein MshC
MRGFTLVELTMVIVIIGILVALVGPRFFDRRVFDERLFYEESLAAVRHAQKLAVASGCSIRVTVASSGYALSYAAACGTLASGSAVRNPAGGYYAAGNPQGVGVAPALDITFNSLGAATGPANVAGFAAGAFSLTVHPTTGFIETTP